MGTLDRYILRRFALNYAILAFAMMTLIVVLDLLNNFNEFLQAGMQAGGGRWNEAAVTIRGILGFYGPLSLVFIGYLGGLVAVGAAGFTLAAMVRARELTAILAAGIGAYRVAAIFIIAGVFVGLMMLADQEWLIPPMMDLLARNQSDVKLGGVHLELDFIPDPSGALLTAERFELSSQVLTNLTILGRTDSGETRWRIVASRATWDTARHGWALEHALRADGLDDLTSLPRAAEPVDFFPTELDPLTIMALRNGRIRRMLSAGQLQSMAASPIAGHTGEFRQILHGRFSMVAVNLLVLTMSLRFFLMRAPRNLLLQAAKATSVCVPVWGAAFLMINTPATALPPIVTAWLPVAIYFPIAVLLASLIET